MTSNTLGAERRSAAASTTNRPIGRSPLLTRYGSLWRLLRPVRGHLLACALLSVLGAGAGLLAYIAVAEIARVALGASDITDVAGTIWMWAGLGIGGGASRLVLVFLSSRLGHYADAAVLHDLRVRLIRQLGTFPIGWFRATGSGAVKRALTSDLEEMHQLIAHALGEVLGAAVAIGVGITYLALVDWRMAGVTVGVLGLWAICFKTAMRSMSLHLERLKAAELRISAASIEYADGIGVVKTFGTGGRILARFAAAVREHREAFGVWVDETRYSSAAARLFGSEMAVLAAVMAVGLWLVASNSLAVADLLPFLVIGIGLPTSLVPAVLGAQGLRKGRMSAGIVEGLLSQPGLAEARRPVEPVGHRIEFRNVGFSYPNGTAALSDVSLVCEPGSITALVGPSGAGKSTLAGLLPRFFDVSAGAISIGGADIRELPTATLLSSLALVFQDVVLLRDTVIANIRIGRPDASAAEVRAAAAAAQIHEVIERLPLGYDTVLGGDGAGLSGGERQRLTIARAILSRAPIVVLDEATAALDPDNETAVQAALATLAAGKTMIVIAHRLETVAGADQIVVLDGGRIAEAGRHRQLLERNGLYARMWRAQHMGAAA